MPVKQNQIIIVQCGNDEKFCYLYAPNAGKNNNADQYHHYYEYSGLCGGSEEIFENTCHSSQSQVDNYQFLYL